MIIAIDGFSACGKSTLARDLAEALDINYIDSGAMYRAVTLYFLQNRIDIDDVNAVKDALSKIDIRFSGAHIFLNGKMVDAEIRTPEVASLVSPVAAISPVRSRLVELQKSFGSEGNLIMDGRDIGSVVFPKAPLKFFITADLDIRAQRRFDELQEKGTPLTTREVVENLKQRDHIDSTREDSPLTKVEDAILIDTSFLSREGQLKLALRYILNDENPLN